MPETVAPAPLPAKVAPAGTPDLGSLFMLAVSVVVVAALYLAREVLIPITLAILLSFVLAPIVSWLRRIHVPQVVAVLISVTVGFGLILALSGVIGLQIASLGDQIPRYASTIEKKIDSVREATLGRMSAVMARLERQAAPAPAAERPNPADHGQAGPLGSGPQPIPVTVQPTSSQPLELARAILTPVLEPLSNLFIVLIISVFILMQREDLRDRLIRLFGSSDLHRTTLAMDDAALRLGRYFLAQVAINTSFGVIIGIGLALIGIPSPALWGVIGALLRFVPYIGPVIAGLLPAAVAAAVYQGWTEVAWTVGLFAVVEALTGQILEPLIYGRSTGLSPAAVVIAAIFWTWIWGPIGLVLSTPLTLCLVVLGRHVDRLEFLDVLLGDQPALTPVENFYQRMLANDSDEALHQAELLLKDRSLTSYYDEVAIEGLRLATNDALRGALSEERLDQLRGSVRSLIDDLADHEDVEPPPEKKPAPSDAPAPARETEAAARAAEATVEPGGYWGGAAATILCIAGRGPLDEEVSAMLAQLLARRGLEIRLASHGAMGRDRIGGLDPLGVAMVCISYAEISGSPAHLHYLLRRLRRRLPGIPILVGIWPDDDEVLRDKRLRAVIGADHFTTSLGDAVEACMAEARRTRSATAGTGPTERPAAGEPTTQDGSVARVA